MSLNKLTITYFNHYKYPRQCKGNNLVKFLQPIEPFLSWKGRASSRRSFTSKAFPSKFYSLRKELTKVKYFSCQVKLLIREITFSKHYSLTKILAKVRYLFSKALVLSVLVSSILLLIPTASLGSPTYCTNPSSQPTTTYSEGTRWAPNYSRPKVKILSKSLSEDYMDRKMAPIFSNFRKNIRYPQAANIPPEFLGFRFINRRGARTDVLIKFKGDTIHCSVSGDLQTLEQLQYDAKIFTNVLRNVLPNNVVLLEMVLLEHIVLVELEPASHEIDMLFPYVDNSVNKLLVDFDAPRTDNPFVN